MHLFLLRHGRAEPAKRGVSDYDRNLTPTGTALLDHQASVFARMNLQADRIFCSPLVRARQTAGIVSRALGLEPTVAAELRTGASFDSIVDFLEFSADVDLRRSRIMLVGHQPYLGETIRRLTGASVVMEPGTLAHVEVRAFRENGGILWGLYAVQAIIYISNDRPNHSANQ